jgi:hypothetical protein
MKVYLTINDIRKLSEGKSFRCEDQIFKPSPKVKAICTSLLDYESLMKVYIPILETNWQVTSIYLSREKRRRRVVR